MKPNLARARRKTQRARKKPNSADIARYEAHKAIWISAHPDSTPGQYEAAMRAVSRACGV